MVTDFQTSNVVSQNFKFLPLLSWRSAIAGLAISLLTYFAFLALAVAFGGIGLADQTSPQTAGTFAAVFLLIATVLSVFAGSYFSVRLARINAEAVGSSQGLLVGSLFMLFLIFQTLALVGTLGQLTGSALGMAGSGLASTAQNPMVQDVISDSIAGLNLQSEPQAVVSGVASRLLRGDQESAKNYLAREAGITSDQADQRIAAAQTQITQGLNEVREASASALKAAGWSSFLLIVLGAISSVLGGYVAARRNENYTLDMRAITRPRQAPAFTTANA